MAYKGHQYATNWLALAANSRSKRNCCWLFNKVTWGIIFLIIASTLLQGGFFVVPQAQAAALTSVSIIPWSSDVSIQGKHTVKFTTTTTIPANGKVLITYPAGFDVSQASFDSWSGFDGGRTLQATGQVITVTRDNTGAGSTAGAKYIVFNNITNQATAASTYTATVETKDSSDVTLDGPTTSANFSTTPIGDGLDTSAPWAKFLSDSRNTGHSTLSGPDYPTLAWIYNSASSCCNGVVQDASGTVYGFDSVLKKIYALNQNGEELWSTNFAINSTSKFALAANGTLYTIVYNGAGGVALYALNTSNGNTKWVSSQGIFDDPYLYGINIGPDGTIYPGQRFHSMAFNSDGTLKWYVNRNGRDATPAVDPATSLIHVAGDSFAGNYYFDGNTNVGYGSSMTTVNVDASGNVYYPDRSGGNPVRSYTFAGTLRWAVGSAGADSSTGALSPDESVWYYVSSGTGGLRAYSTSDGAVLWTNSGVPVGWPNAGLAVDSNGVIYAKRYAVKPDGTTKWTIGPDSSDRAVGKDGYIFYTGYSGLFAYKPWTLSLSTDRASYLPGESVTFTATSSMLKRDPAASDDNKVQVVLGSGIKVPLSYFPTLSSGANTVWTGGYTIPATSPDGTLTTSIEAIAYQVTTDVTTHFDTLPTGFANSGLVSNGSPVVIQIGSSGLPPAFLNPPAPPTPSADNPFGGFKVFINNDASTTNNHQVTLTFATGANTARLALSSTPDFAGASQEPYQSTKSWSLCDSDTCPSGDYTVYAKFYTTSGQSTSAVSATINYQPSSSPPSPPLSPPPPTPPVNPSSIPQATPQVLVAEASQVFNASPQALAQAVGQVRDQAMEQEVARTLVSRIATTELVEQVRTVVTNFVAYGTPSTVALGTGERAGVLASFEAAFKRLPDKTGEWEDILRLASSRLPQERNLEREQQARQKFRRIYLHSSNLNNFHDQAAVNIMAYGLRPPWRKLADETVALHIFADIFNKPPSSTDDWDTIRAIAYSGARR